MKYENLFKIHIPEPCHEDWDKMTPNAQGAFCKSCAKTVVDFSCKTEAEIQKYLHDNINNKICGRFNVSQLETEPVEEPKLKIALEPQASKWNFPSYLMPIVTPFRVVAMSLMLFASLALSSCGNSNEGGGDDDGRTVGIMIVKPDSTVKQDSIKNMNDLRNIKGGVEAKYNPDYNNTTDSTCSTVEDVTTVGKIKVIQNIDTVKVDTSETMLKGEIEPVQKTHGIMLKGDVKREK